MCEAARKLLSTTKPPVEEWELQRDLREVAGDLAVPDQRETILRQLSELKESRQSLESEVEQLRQLVERWPQDRLEYVRLRVRAAAKAVVTGRFGGNR